MPGLLALLQSEKITQEYKKERKAQLLAYGHQFITGELLDDYIERMDADALTGEERNQLLELLMESGNYDRAFELMIAFGYEGISVSKLLLIADQKAAEISGKEDAALYDLCSTCLLYTSRCV